MKRLHSLFVMLVLLGVLLSCKDSDDSDHQCLEGFLTVVNECDQNITITYEELDFEWVEIFIDYCDVEKREEIIQPGEEIGISVFLGECNAKKSSVFNECFHYHSFESISVKYDGRVKDYGLNTLRHFIIRPEDFK